MDLFDTLSFDKPRRTNDGYLVVEARSARTGIQLYRGSEVGLSDTEVVRIFRPEKEVFNDVSMTSFAHRPITDNHPTQLVDSKNWKKFSVGNTGGEIARDGQFIVVPLIVMDEALIEAIEKGKRELSAGYTCDIEMVSGETPDGEIYDGIQTNIRVNHLAVVDKARAGSACRIGDDKPGVKPMATKNVTVDDITIEVTDQGAQVIEKLQKQLADSDTSTEKLVSDHETAIAAKDKELATKDAEIDKLKSEAITVDGLDELAAERASVITDAKTFGDVETKGKSNSEIRRVAVASKLGDDAVKDKSDDYVQARFDGLVEDSSHSRKSGDPVRRAIQGDSKTKVVDSSAAYDEMIEGLENAHRPTEKEAA